LVEAGGSIVVAVAASPVEGRANEEVRRALARALRVPSSSVRLVTGQRSRSKVFEATGVGAVEADRRLRAALDQRKR
jgi:uncharacterized protein YggU (UPF0235/DUF167 family)